MHTTENNSINLHKTQLHFIPVYFLSGIHQSTGHKCRMALPMSDGLTYVRWPYLCRMALPMSDGLTYVRWPYLLSATTAKIKAVHVCLWVFFSNGPVI